VHEISRHCRLLNTPSAYTRWGISRIEAWLAGRRSVDQEWRSTCLMTAIPRRFIVKILRHLCPLKSKNRILDRLRIRYFWDGKCWYTPSAFLALNRGTTSSLEGATVLFSRDYRLRPSLNWTSEYSMHQ